MSFLVPEGMCIHAFGSLAPFELPDGVLFSGNLFDQLAPANRRANMQFIQASHRISKYSMESGVLSLIYCLLELRGRLKLFPLSHKHHGPRRS